MTEPFTIDAAPDDLYIPPGAMEVLLTSFTGPLDVLLYLIRRKRIAIADIPIVEITRQYVAYITLMEQLQFDLAGEYLVMAALLMEMKSRALLPQSPTTTDDEEADQEDPRAVLVRHLQQYARFQAAAQALDLRPRMGRDVHQAQAAADAVPRPKLRRRASVTELHQAMRAVQLRAQHNRRYHVSPQRLSVEERLRELSALLQSDAYLRFSSLCLAGQGRAGIIVTFLALLELAKANTIDITQTNDELFVKRR